jgi:hypothetical protein
VLGLDVSARPSPSPSEPTCCSDVPDSHGVALDTENPDNVPLYQRLGFVVTATVELDGARATAMFRPHAALTRSRRARP